MDLTKTGVYSITNTVNGKQYIGSAARSFKYRFDRHLQKLRTDKHHCLPLQRAWNKYGEEAFKFEVLAICPPSFCLAGEQFYLNAWKPEYNVCKVAGSRLGVIHSEEARKKISDKKKDYYSKPENILKTSELQKEVQNREDISKAKSDRMTKFFLNEENRQKAREKSLKQFSDPHQLEQNRQRGVDRFKDQDFVDFHKKRMKEVNGTKEKIEKNRDAHSCFIYEILTPSMTIETTTSIDRGLDSTHLGNTLRGFDCKGNSVNKCKGYKVLSKTPRQK
jgi:group I intron endonuclease